MSSKSPWHLSLMSNKTRWVGPLLYFQPPSIYWANWGCCEWKKKNSVGLEGVVNILASSASRLTELYHKSVVVWQSNYFSAELGLIMNFLTALLKSISQNYAILKMLFLIHIYTHSHTYSSVYVFSYIYIYIYTHIKHNKHIFNNTW